MSDITNEEQLKKVNVEGLTNSEVARLARWSRLGDTDAELNIMADRMRKVHRLQSAKVKD